MNIYVREADFLITPDDTGKLLVRKGVDIVIEEGQITCIDRGCSGDRSEIMIDGKWKIVFPAMINMHTHLGSSITSTYMIDKISYEVHEDLKKIGKTLNNHVLVLLSMIECTKMLLSGVVGFINLFPNKPVIIKPCIDLGMYVGVGPVIGLDDEISFEKLEGTIPVLGIYEVDIDMIDELRELYEKASELDFKKQYQVSTSRREVFLFKRKTGKWPIEYLYENNLIDQDTSLAHLNWVSSMEFNLLRETKALAIITPDTTMYLGERGYAPVYELLRNNIKVSIGCEGFSNPSLNILRELRDLILLYKYSYGDNRLKLHDILPHILLQPYRYLGIKGGVLKEGYPATLVIASYRKQVGVQSSRPYDLLITDSLEIEYVVVEGSMRYSIEERDQVFEKLYEGSEKIREYGIYDHLVGE